MQFDTELFPKTDRVVYRRNPIREVICQVRFPAILKIASHAPADFQDLIRNDFPYFSHVRPDLPPNIPNEIASLILADNPGGYSFENEDRTMKVILESSFVALSTKGYVGWERVGSCISSVLTAFADVYRPSFYERVGLRYVNAISRRLISDEQVQWADLIRPELIGELCLPAWQKSSLEIGKSIRAVLNQSGDKLFLQHGFSSAQSDQDHQYILDFDYYTEQRIEANYVHETIDRLHRFSGDAFRWSITSRLHQALEPDVDLFAV